MLSRFFLLLLLCYFINGDSSKETIDWSLRKKLKVIENSIIENQNLLSYENKSNNGMNRVFENDTTKVKRSYNNQRCIRDLIWIKNHFNNRSNQWAIESNFIRFYSKVITIFALESRIFFQFFIVFEAWGSFPSGDYKADFGNYDQCDRLLPTISTNKSQKMISQYCIVEFRTKKLNKK